MADASWALNGTDLANLGAVVRGTVLYPSLSPRRSVLSVPSAHGSIPTGRLPVHEETRVIIRMVLSASSMASLRDSSTELQALLMQPTLTLTRTIAGVVTSAPVELTSAAPGDLWPSSQEWTLEFAVPGAWFRSASATSTSALASPLTSWTVAHLAGSTAPVGDALVRFTGPVTNPSVACLTSGTGLSWAGTVAAGSYLYLDAGKLTARTSAVNWHWTTGGTLASHLLDYPAAGRLQLWPDATRSVKVAVGGESLTSASAVAIQCGGCYL